MLVQAQKTASREAENFKDPPLSTAQLQDGVCPSTLPEIEIKITRLPTVEEAVEISIKAHKGSWGSKLISKLRGP